MQASAIKAYEVLKKYLPEEVAEIIMTQKDESLSRWVASKEDIASVREDLNKVEIALREDLNKVEMTLREEMARLEMRLVRWFIGTSIALVGIVFTLMKFTAN